MKSARRCYSSTTAAAQDDREDSGGSNCGGVAAQCLGSWHQWWSTHSATAVDGEDNVSGGSEVLVCGFRRLVSQSRPGGSISVVVGRRCRWVSIWVFFFFFFFFFFFGFVGVGSVIRGRHGWWSLAWVASLASLLAWG